ncbi:unnamed protein product [Mytilus coruscus]|uniref:Uncharacterized protein n=1 Tax=Mytilus coruscus TaxID=42192 RepID=A0A6J8E898_MYTCO|nr:unnamed protein product [Mytilus coruscus]
MFGAMNFFPSWQHYVTGYTADYLRTLQGVDNTPQQVMSELTHEYSKFFWNSALDYNSLLINMMKVYIEGTVHPVLQQTTDVTEYTYNNAVLPAVEYTSDSIFALISFSENVNRRLKRNKGNRIPKIISRIENLYKLMDKSFEKRTRLLDEINFWCPVIMAQEKKLRMANKAHEDNSENVRVGQIRNLGSHVDLNLIRIKDNLDDMSAGVKREMSITASLYDN